MINLHPMCDYVRRPEKGNSAHSHLALVCHTFMTVANRVCGEEQILWQADTFPAQDKVNWISLQNIISGCNCRNTCLFYFLEFVMSGIKKAGGALAL